MTDINQNNPQNNEQPQELRYQNFDDQKEEANPPNNQVQQQNNQNLQ